MVVDPPAVSATAQASDLVWSDWTSTPAIPAVAFRRIVETAALEGSKWDIQVGDVPTLCPFALTASRSSVDTLFGIAETLASELSAVEQRLADRPDLWPKLGLPRKVRSLLAGYEPWTPSAARILRFDFHPTTDGWRVSEVNSDVPGGFNESTTFSQMVCDTFNGMTLAGRPLDRLADRLASAARPTGTCGLLSAPGYTEDAQVLSGMAAALRARGVDPVRLKPEQLRWRQGRAHTDVSGSQVELGALYRFFQGEWSTRFSNEDWRTTFRGGVTPVCNPATAILTESKRLPLIWEKLGISLPSWKQFLPPTRSMWDALGQAGDSIVLKEAYCNTGDAVTSRSWTTANTWLGHLGRSILSAPSSLCQERFETLSIETPAGPLRPCLGVYTLDGQACGIYARLSAKPFIDFSARDVAVLIRPAHDRQV